MPSEYKVNDGENIFDAALATYGSLEQVYKIIQDNPQLESIDQDLPELPGLVLMYDETLQVTDEQGEKQIVLPKQVNEYEAQDGQSLFDIALMVYGNIEKALQIVLDNSLTIPNIHQNIVGGTKVRIDPVLNDDLVLTKYLVKNDLIVNTSEPKVNIGPGFSFGFRLESFY